MKAFFFYNLFSLNFIFMNSKFIQNLIKNIIKKKKNEKIQARSQLNFILLKSIK